MITSITIEFKGDVVKDIFTMSRRCSLVSHGTTNGGRENPQYHITWINQTTKITTEKTWSMDVIHSISISRNETEE